MKNSIKKLSTTEDLLNDRTLFSEDMAQKIQKNALKEAKKYWGGARQGAGRKPKNEYALNITIKVSAKELEFLKYARTNGINLQHLIQE